ncbi:MAG: T9SS type A sorting domain-containing protein [Ferruginibacter sp.]
MKKQLFKVLLAFSITVFSISISFTQIAPAIQWQKSFGGSNSDVGNSIRQTTDGGYIMSGWTSSNDADVSGNHGGYFDGWVVKLNNFGNIAWQKSLGGTGYDLARVIQQTADGGYIIAGESDSNDGDVSGNHGGFDYWVIKLDNAGNITWQKCLGGSGSDVPIAIQQTVDGGFIVAGYSSSNDGDVSGNHSYYSNDYWVVKLYASGNIEWQKCLGGTSDEYATCIQQTADGGYIIAGSSNSNDADVSGNHGNGDSWIVKLNSNGTIAWQKCLGGSAVDGLSAIQQTVDGGYIAAGFSSSNNGDVSGNHGDADFWVVKLNSSGNITWQKCLGGSSYDAASSVQQLTDGGFIVGGYSFSNDGDASGNHGSFDYWVVKLNGSGIIVWQKSLGGTDSETAGSIQHTTDGGYIVTGESYSNDGDVTGNHGNGDCWVVKLVAGAVVPLRLLSFTGILENNATKLNWQTTDEINTNHFIVERSANAISFSAIGKVNAQTSSSITHSYHYADNAALPGTNFYRLKMEDNGGRFTYSDEILINHNNANEIIIAPNPVAGYTSISFTLLQKQKTRISIYNIAGKLEKILANAELPAGTHELKWDAKDENGNRVSAGIYFLQLDTGNKSETIKLAVFN